MSRTKSSARAQQMHALISKYLSSGLTQKRFYEQEELPRSTFLYWLNHYRKYKKAKKPAFIPLPLKEHPSGPSGCSIIFPDNITIRFDRQPEAELLLKLINAEGA